jgi:RHS repeat-associated protein
MDAFGIINMNGRVYDPLTAMFFSPDPFVQAPGNWLNYNRYGYCMNNPTGYIDPSGYQAIKQAENGNSIWYVFQQMAQTERRLGISDGGIGGSSFGSGFTGYSYSDAFVEARSKGFKGTYSDFITISLTQMSRASFNGKVEVHTWGPSSTSVNSKKLNTFNISLVNGNSTAIQQDFPTVTIKDTKHIVINNLIQIDGYNSASKKGTLDGEIVYNAQTLKVESGKVGKVSVGKDEITYGEYLSVGATVDGKLVVDISTPPILGMSVGTTIYLNQEQMKNDFIRGLNTVCDGFGDIKKWAGAGSGAGSYTLSPYFY